MGLKIVKKNKSNLMVRRLLAESRHLQVGRLFTEDMSGKADMEEDSQEFQENLCPEKELSLTGLVQKFRTQEGEEGLILQNLFQ